MGRLVRSRGWRFLAVAMALILGLGIVPGLFSTSSASAQSEELTQREFTNLIEDVQESDPVYGPEEGELDHDPDRVTFESADVELADFLVTVTFENPYAASAGQFDYGIQFRSFDDNGEARFLRFILISDGTWGVTDGTDDVLATDTYDDIDDSRRGENTMTLYAEGDVVHLGINGDYITTVEVTFDDEGDIAVGTSFLADSFQDGESTPYVDFTVWDLGGGSGRQDPEEDPTEEPDEEETPRGTDEPEIDGTQYESETYGYTVVYDDTWEVGTDESSSDGDILEISNGQSSLQFLSFETSDTPSECIQAIIDSLTADDTIENVEIALDNNDEELIGEDDGQAYVVLFVTYTTDEGSVDFTAFYNCYTLADGDAMLQITHLALADVYNDEIENRVAVLDTLDLTGGGGGNTDPDPDPVPTEEGTDLPEGSVTFLLDAVGSSSDIIFGTLIPDGNETTVSLLALTSEPGDYEATIHEGSCRTPGDPVFELGAIDSTGLLDTSVDLPVEDLTNGDFVMIVSDGGDFEDGAIACGVLEEIPTEE